MAKKLTKAEAERLITAYAQAQKAAAAENVTAYNAAQDAAAEATARDVALQAAAVEQTAQKALDTAAVKALIERYAVAQAMADRGLTRSGTAQSADRAVGLVQQQTARTVGADRRAALAVLSEKLVSARQAAANKKKQHAASINQTVANKIAEKRLSLSKSAV